MRRRFTPMTLMLAALMLMFVIISLLYVWATPIFEASDELWHFAVVDHIATTGTLPVQVIGETTAWRQEGSQPPLYYLLAAALVAPIDRSDRDTLREPNPHAIAGVPGAAGNKNLILHDAPHPPLRGTALAVYGVRLFSVALGAVTIYAVFRSARLLAYYRPGVAFLALGLAAFNPMFLFISASVNNDNLVIALNSLTIWRLLALLERGFSWRRNAVIAVLAALASLSKLSGLVMIPAALLTGVLAARRSGDWTGFYRLAGLLAGAWALLAGWWYWRNLDLYGEFFGTRTMAAIAGARETPFTLSTLLDEFQGFRFSYWGVFGAMNIQGPRLFYDVMDAIVVLALLGLGRFLWGGLLALRSERPSARRAARADIERAAVLALIIVTGSFGVIAWTAKTFASQGRLLFPFTAAISPLLAYGLWTVRWLLPLPRGALLRLRRALDATLSRVAPVALATFAMMLPLMTIAPEYARPARLSGVPETARPVSARFGEVELLGYDAPDRRYQPGDDVPVTLYWHVIDRSERDLSLFIHAIAAGAVVGKVDSYPGGGALRTTAWQPGAIYRDRYVIALDDFVTGESRLQVQVGWWHAPGGQLIEAVDSAGQPLEAVMLDIGGFAGTRGADAPPISGIERVDFGSVIGLVGYRLDDNVLTLVWETSDPPAADFTVFAQVWSDDDTLVGQGDAPPDLPTRYWQRGERYTTEHRLQFPPTLEAGSYRLMVGWYNPGDNRRLTVDAPDNAYPLTRLTLP